MVTWRGTETEIIKRQEESLKVIDTNHYLISYKCIHMSKLIKLYILNICSSVLVRAQYLNII